MAQKLIRIGIALLLVGGLYALNRFGVIRAALSGIESLGVWSKPAFVLLHAASVVAFVPSVLPTFAAGVLFGFAWGVPLTVLGAALGAVVAFGIGRGVGRSWVERRFAQDSRFRALSDLAQVRGWRIVALARLTPIFPFSIANYAFGVTPMKGWHYLGATALGTIPSNAVYVYLGTLTGDVAAAADGDRARSPLEWTLLVGGLIIAGVMVGYIRRLAAESLERQKSEEDPGESVFE